MLLRRCSRDSSAGIAVIFAGQACECFEGFLFKCCKNRLINEASTQIIFALFKYSCLSFTFINLLRCVRGLFVSLLAAGFGFGDHYLQLRWGLPFIFAPQQEVQHCPLSLPFWQTLINNSSSSISQDSLYVFILLAECSNGEQKHSQQLQLLEVSDWSADDLAASPRVVHHVPALTGRGWSCIYKQSPVFGQAKERHMDGGRSGALV